MPGGLVLGPSHPNPFGAETTIRFVIPAWLDQAPVELAVYDVRGSLLRRLVDRRLSAGRHRVAWDGRDENGRPVPAAIYFNRLQVGPLRRVQNVTLTR